MSWRAVVVVLVGLAAVGGGLLGLQIYTGYPRGDGWSGEGRKVASPSSEASTETRQQPVAASLGYLKPANGVVQVSSPLVGERLSQLHANEGDRLTRGDLVAEVDDTFLRLNLELAEAQRDEAKKKLVAEQKMARARLEQAELAVEQAKQSPPLELQARQAQLEARSLSKTHAAKTLERFTALHKQDATLVSEHEVDEQELLLAKAQTELTASEIALQQAREQIGFQQQSAEADRKVAEANVRLAEETASVAALEKQVAIAKARLDRTRVDAPTDGVVLETFLRPGEFLAETPILQMANLGEIICEAEVFDGDIHRISIGQPVEIRSRAFRGSRETTFVKGTVQRIGNSVKPPQLRPLDPYEPSNRHVVDVRIRLQDPDTAARLVNEDARSLVDLQVEVSFLPETPSGEQN